jgi:hypothetical protein
MKKILLTLALAAFAMTANAQWVLGGQIGFNHNGVHNDNYTLGSTATTSVAFGPKIGYQLDDKWQIGATILVGYNYNRGYLGASDSYTSTANLQFGIAPYARYYFGEWKNWSLFAEAKCWFGMSPESTTYTYVNGNETGSVKNGDDATTLGISVVPGMNYKFSDKFSMDFYLNIAELSWNMVNTNGMDTHNFTAGVSFDSQSVNNYLNLFTIGFNYHF